MTAIEAGGEYLSVNFDDLKMPADTIKGVEFDSCTFNNCDFSETVFSRCKFIDCEFSNCNLSLVLLDYSRLSEVSFTDCKLVGVDWTKADWPNLALPAPIQFKTSILNEASFYGLNLSELVMQGCKAHYADFREANLSKSNLVASDFSAALFGGTDLTEADFTEAAEFDIDINRNRLQGAIFNRYEAVRLLECLEIVLVD